MVALERRQVGGAGEALGHVLGPDPPRRARQQLDERPGSACGGTEPRGEPVGDVGEVAAEELVGALAGEDDLHVTGGEARDEVGGDRRGVAERLVERDGELAEQRGRVGPQHELVVVGAVALRDERGRAHARRTTTPRSRS